jgi:hypothetical protein
LLALATTGAVCGNDPRDCNPPCFTWQTCESSSGTCVQSRCAVAEDCGPHTTCDASGRCQPVPCHDDTDCDDRQFCNGHETCASPSDGSPRGCRAGTPPCASGAACNESYRLCGACAANPDADRDGHVSAACGGDDCDDTDPERHPGAVEICFGTLPSGRSAADHDEDCNPCTVYSPDIDADGDADLDGFPSVDCKNPWLTSSAPVGCDLMRVEVHAGFVFGRDCAPTNSDIHPNQLELCNHVDDNCDGRIDEGVTMAAYYDSDRDGAGQVGAPVQVCPQDLGNGYALFPNDCDDKNPAIVPGSIICGATPNAVQICRNDGTWMDAACANPQQTCVVQPNGTGVCR